LLIAVMILLAVAAMGALVAGSISSSDVIDSHLTGYAIEAQFAAESGVERALEEFSNAAYAPPPAAAVNPCVAGSFTAGPYTVTTNRTFTTAFKAATDFSGNALSFSQCRVQVTGSVTGTAGTPLTRTVQAILDRNLAAGANPGFNDMVGGGATAISRWTSTAAPIPFDTAGGPEAAPTAAIPTRCTRAAYAVKPRNAPSGIAAYNTGSVAIVPNFRVATSAQTVTVRFNYRVITIGNAAGTVCTTLVGGASVAPPGGATNDMNVWFRLLDTANHQFTTVAARVFGAAMTGGTPLTARNVGNALPCTPTTQQATAAADYGTCAAWYQGVVAPVTATTKAQATVDIPATGAASTGIIQQLDYYIYLRASGTAREAWIDNIELINSTGAGVARTAEWRDCSVSTCP